MTWSRDECVKHFNNKLIYDSNAVERSHYSFVGLHKRNKSVLLFLFLFGYFVLSNCKTYNCCVSRQLKFEIQTLFAVHTTEPADLHEFHIISFAIAEINVSMAC